jgi:hypothetical protein
MLAGPACTGAFPSVSTPDPKAPGRRPAAARTQMHSKKNLEQQKKKTRVSPARRWIGKSH